MIKTNHIFAKNYHRNVQTLYQFHRKIKYHRNVRPLVKINQYYKIIRIKLIKISTEKQRYLLKINLPSMPTKLIKEIKDIK